LSDSKGDLLVGSNTGFYRISAGRNLEKLDNHGAAAILEDRDGRIWVDSGGALIGLRVFEIVGGKLKLFKTYKTKDGLPREAFFFALRQTSDGRIFVGLDNGLCEFLPDAKEGDPKFRLLNSDKTTSLAEDSAGNLWFGTELKGAWKLVQSGFTSFGEKDGIAETEDIRANYASSDGEFFCRPDRETFSVSPTENLKKFCLSASNSEAGAGGFSIFNRKTANGGFRRQAACGVIRVSRILPN
jgi:hypothetical protein